MVTLFFFNDTATTEIYTLSLHDALPIPAEHVDTARCGRCSRRSPRPPYNDQVIEAVTARRRSPAFCTWSVCQQGVSNRTLRVHAVQYGEVIDLPADPGRHGAST